MTSPALDIPLQAPHLAEHMAQTHANVKVTPNGNRHLAYGIAVPRTWALSEEFGPVPGGLLRTQGLGFFTNAASAGAPVVAVTVTPVPFEIPVDAWTRHALEFEGWKIVQARFFPGPTGLFYDITGVRVVHDVEEVRRTTARSDGSNIFCVNTMCARDRWDAAKEIFWIAHVTFEILGGTGQDRMEPWIEARAADPAFHTAFPFSWNAEPATPPPGEQGVSGLELRLLDVKGEILLAYVQVRARRGQPGEKPRPLEALGAAALSRVEKSGFKPAGPLHPIPAAEDPRAIAVPGYRGGLAGTGALGSSDVLVRFGFVQLGEVAFTFTLLSPTTHDDLLVALRAQRAYEIARFTTELL
jgi:hypothetical protein